MPVYQLASGEPYAIEIRPGADVAVRRLAGVGPVEVVFSDHREQRGTSGRWTPIVFILPADVARKLSNGMASLANSLP